MKLGRISKPSDTVASDQFDTHINTKQTDGDTKTDIQEGI